MRPYDSLRTNGDFSRVRKRGRRLDGSHLSMFAAPSRAARRPRIGIVVAKTVGGAVERNRARRRIRAALDLLAPASYDLVVTARPSARTVAFEGLRAEITELLARLGR